MAFIHLLLYFIYIDLIGVPPYKGCVRLVQIVSVKIKTKHFMKIKNITYYSLCDKRMNLNHKVNC